MNFCQLGTLINSYLSVIQFLQTINISILTEVPGLGNPKVNEYKGFDVFE